MARPDAISTQISGLRAELQELEDLIPRWNSDSLAGAKKPRAVARRIVLSAQRLEALVKEDTLGVVSSSGRLGP